MTSKPIKPPGVHEEAARWAQGFDGGDPEEKAAFLKWVSQSPREGTELMVAGLLVEELNKIDPARTIDVEQLIAQAKSNVSPIGPHVDLCALPAKPRMHLWIGMATASAASVAAILAASWLYHSTLLPEGTYMTSVGEQRVVTLDDGSVLTLNTQSRVHVLYSANARNIHLEQGQAAFKVVHDAARPFYVHAGAAEIRDIGTDFDVRYFAETNRVAVAVTEGVVEVSGRSRNSVSDGPGAAPDIEPSTLIAGQRTVIDPTGKIEPVVSVDSNDVNAWKEQRLKFLDTPLEEIAAEFNRYNRKPLLRVEGDAARAKRFNGNFLAHSFDSLYKSLESEGLSHERRGNEVIIRAAPDASTNPALNP
jgi:transmembrane sensor